MALHIQVQEPIKTLGPLGCLLEVLSPYVHTVTRYDDCWDTWIQTPQNPPAQFGHVLTVGDDRHHHSLVSRHPQTLQLLDVSKRDTAG